MSAIFGYTCADMTGVSADQILHMMDHWNASYGSAAAQMRAIDACSGLGCRIEHFAHAFPWGGPILEYNGKLAVIDALLYNRKELLEQLSRTGNDPISDEELLLCWIQERGYDALATVNGDFSGAVYDPENQSWVLFRDHLGVRPVFYYLKERSFAFSTDIRSLAAFGGQRCRPNATHVYNIMMGYNPLTLCQTEYQDILCVPPGSVMKITSNDGNIEVNTHSYWKLNQKKILLDSEEKYEQELMRLVRDAIQRRLDAVPGKVGAELSGGLDSSVISILMNRLGADACYYSWSDSPEELPLQDGEDERKVIQDICRQENITCQYRNRAERIQLEEAMELVYPGYSNTYDLTIGSRWMHSQGANAVFTGHGGDEGVSRRSNIYELFYHKEYKAFFDFYQKRYKGRRLGSLRAPLRAIRDIFHYRNEYSKPPQYAHMDCSELLGKAFREQMQASAENVLFHFHYAPVLYIEQGGSRPRMDNAAFQGALSGVRYLFPYLDYRVIDFAVSVPRALYISERMDRKLFRNAFRQIIPVSLYNVFYKDFASQRNKKEAPSVTAEDLKLNLVVRDLLNREYWGDILDWDYIDQMSAPPTDDPKAISHFYTCISNLTKCLLIQHAATKAQEELYG